MTDRKKPGWAPLTARQKLLSFIAGLLLGAVADALYALDWPPIAILRALAVAFAAFCVWLAVRIVNRRERWAKRTAVGLIVVLAYPLSFGPACWLNQRTGFGGAVVCKAFRPLVIVKDSTELGKMLDWYASLGISDPTLFPWFIDNGDVTTVLWSGPE